MTRIDEYRMELMEQTKASSTGRGVGVDFVDIVLHDLEGNHVFNDPVVFYWNGKTKHGGDIKIYGYDYDETDNSFTLFCSSFEDTTVTQNLNKSTIKELSTQAFRFVQESLENERFSEALENEACELFELINEVKGRGFGINKVKAVIISNGVIANRVKELPPDFVFKQNSNIDVEIQIWDIVWLFNSIYSPNNPERTIVDFDEYKEYISDKIHCLRIPQDEMNKYECYLLALPGIILAKLYRQYGSLLLEGNIRSFLTTKTSVNKKIQATISNTPEKFFIYNNGIAAIADSVDIKLNSDGTSGIINSISGFQIINGGQTTASLALADQKMKCDLSKITVQVKLTVIKSDDTNRAVDIQQISKSSNSQNKVSDADFFANHEFHTRMENISKTIFVKAPSGIPYQTLWYYERMKGQYLQETFFKKESEKVAYYRQRPKEQKITKEELAKYDCILRGDTIAVNKGSNESFKSLSKVITEIWDDEKQSRKKDSYNELYYKKIANVALIYRTMEKEITKSKQGPWAGSYRANMLYFSISHFFKLVEKQYPTKSWDCNIMWDNNCLSPRLIELFVIMAKIVHGVITNGEEQNVTQWCKKQACSNAVAKAFESFIIPEDIVAEYLGDIDRIKSEVKNQKEWQKLSGEVELMNLVFSSEYIKGWESLYRFCNLNINLFTNYQSKLKTLQQIVKMSKNQYTPISAKQYKEALSTWDDALAYNWRPELK